jgi:hypothetical protein
VGSTSSPWGAGEYDGQPGHAATSSPARGAPYRRHRSVTPGTVAGAGSPRQTCAPHGMHPMGSTSPPASRGKPTAHPVGSEVRAERGRLTDGSSPPAPHECAQACPGNRFAPVSGAGGDRPRTSCCASSPTTWEPASRSSRIRGGGRRDEGRTCTPPPTVSSWRCGAEPFPGPSGLPAGWAPGGSRSMCDSGKDPAGPPEPRPGQHQPLPTDRRWSSSS